MLSATAVAPTLARARADAYTLLAGVTLDGGQSRTDIAARAVAGEISV